MKLGHPTSGFPGNLSLVFASRLKRSGQTPAGGGFRERDVFLGRGPWAAAAAGTDHSERHRAAASSQRGAPLAAAAEQWYSPLVWGQQPGSAGPERRDARGAAR